MKSLKLIVFGCARHGKDTAAEILCKNFDLTACSSSWFAMERVMVPYFASKGITYPSLQECYADRMNHRQEWYEEIKAYNTPDSIRLGRDLFAEFDIYIGVRNHVELAGMKTAGLFDYSIWVDRSKILPPESNLSSSVNPSMADYILDNNGTLEQLEVRTRNLYLDLISLEYAGGLK
jgi:hypothetical protein